MAMWSLPFPNHDGVDVVGIISFCEVLVLFEEQDETDSFIYYFYHTDGYAFQSWHYARVGIP